MTLYTLFVIFIVIAAILMIGIVLIQESKGGGLASNFASYNQIGGVRKTTDFIEKTTWGLAIAMVVFSVVCAYVAPNSGAQRSVTEGMEAPAANPNTLPSFDASQQKQDAPATNAAPAADAKENAAAPAADAKKEAAPAAETPAKPAK